jgi:hypothetical protein
VAGAIPADEARGWQLASTLIQDGILGFIRLVATLTGLCHNPLEVSPRQGPR